MQAPPAAPTNASDDASKLAVKSDELAPKQLPKGVVLGKDGKP